MRATIRTLLYTYHVIKKRYVIGSWLIEYCLTGKFDFLVLITLRAKLRSVL